MRVVGKRVNNVPLVVKEQIHYAGCNGVLESASKSPIRAVGWASQVTLTLYLQLGHFLFKLGNLLGKAILHHTQNS